MNIKQLMEAVRRVLDRIFLRQSVRISKARSMKTLEGLFTIEVLDRENEQSELASALKDVSKAYMLGIHDAPGVNNDKLLAQRALVEGKVKEFVSKLSGEYRANSLRIISEGMKKGHGLHEISSRLQKELGLARARSNTIARTEVMRAYSVGSYLQAKSEGHAYFCVDCRPLACTLCRDTYEGKIFGMDELGMLPPLHPNCACIAEFFMDESAADVWSEDHLARNEFEREKMEDAGYKIPKDGTGSMVEYNYQVKKQ